MTWRVTFARLYMEAVVGPATPPHIMFTVPEGKGAWEVKLLLSCPGNAGAAAAEQRKAGAYTRPLFGST
jgi:hypothetical protein